MVMSTGVSNHTSTSSQKNIIMCPKPPRLKFTPEAWGKMWAITMAAKFSEVSSWGISSEKDPNLIVDFVVPKQSCSPGGTKMDEEWDAAWRLENFASNFDDKRIVLWHHTHYTFDCFWSGTDVATIEKFDCRMPRVDATSGNLWPRPGVPTTRWSVVTNHKGDFRCRADVWDPIRMYADNLDIDLVIQVPYLGEVLVDARSFNKKGNELDFTALKSVTEAVNANVSLSSSVNYTKSSMEQLAGKHVADLIDKNKVQRNASLGYTKVDVDDLKDYRDYYSKTSEKYNKHNVGDTGYLKDLKSELYKPQELKFDGGVNTKSYGSFGYKDDGKMLYEDTKRLLSTSKKTAEDTDVIAKESGYLEAAASLRWQAAVEYCGGASE